MKWQIIFGILVVFVVIIVVCSSTGMGYEDSYFRGDTVHAVVTTFSSPHAPWEWAYGIPIAWTPSIESLQDSFVKIVDSTSHVSVIYFTWDTSFNFSVTDAQHVTYDIDTNETYSLYLCQPDGQSCQLILDSVLGSTFVS